MNELAVRAYGKINLGLDVTGRRADGYHLVKMILQTVDVFDEVLLKKAEGLHSGPDSFPIALDCDNGLAADSSNLAWKAAALVMREKGLSDGIEIHIKKNIPMAAGMAGGSADAAAVINGMDTLFELGMSQAEKDAIALRLGADVPFCLRKGTYLAEGIGEKLTKLPAPPLAYPVLIKPEFGISTKWSYETLDSTDHPTHPDMDGVISAIHEGDLQKMCDSLGNILEIPALQLHPELSAIKEILMEHGASGSLMSGSGTTVFGLFAGETEAVDAYEFFRDHPIFGSRTFRAGFINSETE